MRADEHEGDLNSTLVARAADMREAEARKILTQTYRLLADDDNFLLWFQKIAYPTMAQRVPEHGADLERFMGRRNLVIEVIEEMDLVVPGFLSRLLGARDRYAKMLAAAERTAEKEQ